jgi:hypothetical protein
MVPAAMPAPVLCAQHGVASAMRPGVAVIGAIYFGLGKSADPASRSAWRCTPPRVMPGAAAACG